MGLLIGNGRDRSVNLPKSDGERLWISLRSILEKADGHGFSELDRRRRIAAPMDAGENSVPEGNVVRDFVQLAVDRKLIAARIREKREPIAAWHNWIRDNEIAIWEL